DLRGTARVDWRKVQATRACCCLYCGKLAWSSRHGRFPHDRDATDPGGDLLKQLQPLPGYGIFEVGKARDIAARMGQAFDIARADRVCDRCEHDRYGVGRIPAHSVPSSAVESRVAGTVRPSALAVLRLITNSNLVGCTTGKSPGLALLRIRPT